MFRISAIIAIVWVSTIYFSILFYEFIRMNILQFSLSTFVVFIICIFLNLRSIFFIPLISAFNTVLILLAIFGFKFFYKDYYLNHANMLISVFLHLSIFILPVSIAGLFNVFILRREIED